MKCYVLLSLISAIGWNIMTVHGHGYLKTPRSRNFVASQDGKSHGGTYSTPAVEYCPHCLNRGGPLAACGLVDNRNYDKPPNAIGGTMPTNVQGTYGMGGTVEVDVILTAHHMGHFEFHACPLTTPGEVPTQECFKSNPVKVKRDVLYGAPSDINYPNRAYIPPLTFSGIVNDIGGSVPGSLYRYELQLPPNLHGNLVLLQWYYLTGNSCKHPGYDKYPFPTTWGGDVYGSLGFCNVDDSDGGSGTPERFWNCAEISIASGASPVPPTISAPLPAPSPPITNPSYPVASPIKVPDPVVAVPVKSPTSPVATSPTSSTAGPCGDGVIGNGVCSNMALCCSKWGYCGSTSSYCDINSVPVLSPVKSPVVVASPTSPIATPSSSSAVGTCGGGTTGNGVCSNTSLCCSKWGHCGLTSSYCGVNSAPVSSPVKN